MTETYDELIARQIKDKRERYAKATNEKKLRAEAYKIAKRLQGDSDG